MIYVRAEDQDDPHSEIRIEIKGTVTLIGHEATALMDSLYEKDPNLFHSIVRSVIRQHVEDFSRLFNE